MTRIVFAIIFIIIAIVLSRFITKPKPTEGEGEPGETLPVLKQPSTLKFTRGFQIVSILIALFLLLSTSYVIIDAQNIGQLTRIYLGKSMKPGQIIAFEGEKGPQARIFAPGFHFLPLLNVLFEVEEVRVIEVPDGKYGYVVAKDGSPLRRGQYLADAWPEGELNKWLDAKEMVAYGLTDKVLDEPPKALGRKKSAD